MMRRSWTTIVAIAGGCGPSVVAVDDAGGTTSGDRPPPMTSAADGNVPPMATTGAATTGAATTIASTSDDHDDTTSGPLSTSRSDDAEDDDAMSDGAPRDDLGAAIDCAGGVCLQPAIVIDPTPAFALTRGNFGSGNWSDIATATADGIMIHWSNGDGTYEPAELLPTSAPVRDVEWTVFDSLAITTGLVAVTSDGLLHAFVLDPQGGFVAKPPQPCGDDPIDVTPLLTFGSSYPSQLLVLARGSGDVWPFSGTADGTLIAGSPLFIGGDPVSISTGGGGNIFAYVADASASIVHVIDFAADPTPIVFDHPVPTGPVHVIGSTWSDLVTLGVFVVSQDAGVLSLHLHVGLEMPLTQHPNVFAVGGAPRAASFGYLGFGLGDVVFVDEVAGTVEICPFDSGKGFTLGDCPGAVFDIAPDPVDIQVMNVDGQGNEDIAVVSPTAGLVVRLTM